MFLCYNQMIDSEFAAMKKLLRILILSLFISTFIYVLPAFAQTTILDGTLAREHMNANGSQLVFTDDDTGYIYYCDGSNLFYQKTTNGGTSWASQVQISSAAIDGDCGTSVVWYDQWTPSDTGDLVHILVADRTTDDDLIYIEFDTSDDSSATAVNISDGASMDAGNYEVWLNNIAFTKATDGDLYAAVADDTSDYVLTCTGTCTTAGNWAETSGASPFEGDDDHIQLMPLATGDIIMIQHDLSADVVESKVWNETSWSAFTTIENSVEDLSTTIDEFGSPPLVATHNPDDHTIYLAYIDYNTGGDFGTGDDDDIKTAKYSGGSWSSTTNASTDNDGGVAPYGLSISFDDGNDDVYLVYSGPDNITSGTHDDGSTNYYYKSSDDEMSSWGAQSSPISTGDTTDWRTRLTGLNLISNERIYLAWFNDAGASNEYIYGETIADVTPPAGGVPEFETYAYLATLLSCFILLFRSKKIPQLYLKIQQRINRPPRSGSVQGSFRPFTNFKMKMWP
jgi:hypothetical protein